MAGNPAGANRRRRPYPAYLTLVALVAALFTLVAAPEAHAAAGDPITLFEKSLGESGHIRAAAAVGNFVVFGTYTTPGNVYVVNASNPALPVIGPLPLGDGENLLTSAVAVGNYVYFGTDTNPGKVVAINVDGTGIPTQTGTATADSNEGFFRSAAVANNNTLVFGDQNSGKPSGSP